MIQKKFLRAVGTGLINDSVKYQMKSCLDDPTVTDDVLIAKLNEAASLEWERQQKFKNNSREAKVKELKTEVHPDQEVTVGAVGGRDQSSSTPNRDKMVKSQPTATRKESELHDIIKQLKEEITEIKGAMKESNRWSSQRRPSRKQGCRDCQDKNKGEECDHCFKCGQSGHHSRGCRSRKKPTDRSEQVDMSANTVTPVPSPSPSQSKRQKDAHKLITDSIQQLVTKFAANTQDKENEVVCVSLISPERRTQLLNLIGKKYIITCQLEGVKTRALWDTGSQVCLINEKWRQQNIPHTTVRSISEILGPDTLDGRAVKQTPIPFSGSIEIKFGLPTDESTELELLVPVLVAHGDGVAEEPIIGFNAIEYLLERGIEPPRVVTGAVSTAFSFDCKKAEVFVKVMKSGEEV